MSEPSWIRMAGCENRKNLFLDFYRDFFLGEDLGNEPLEISITAVSAFTLYVNGSFIARGPAVSYRTRWYYQTVRIPRDLVCSGHNRLSVVMHHDGEATQTTQEFSYGTPGLIAWGSIAEFSTDESWMVRRSPRYSGESQLSRWGFYKEFYHGDLEDRWQKAGFVSGSEWEPAVIAAAKHSPQFAQNLVPLTLPALKTENRLPGEITGYQNNGAQIYLPVTGKAIPWNADPIMIHPGKTGSMPELTFDFARMTVGYPEIRTSGSFCIYEVWYGETLDTYRTEVVRTGSSGLWRAYHRRAFRYLKIRFIAMEGPVCLESVSALHTCYAYPEGASLVTDSPRWNTLVDISLETLKVNTSYHFEDCPGREQALWIFDLRVMARISYYYFGDAALVRKNLLQMMSLQRSDGSIPAAGPKENICQLIDFCFHLVAAWREYYDFSGDLETVKSIYPALVKLDGFIQRFADSDGLLWNYGVSGWGVFLDWSSRLYKSGKSVILNSLYCEYLEHMSYLSERSGNNGSEYVHRHGEVMKAARNLLWNPARGLFADSFDQGALVDSYSFQGNFAAVYAGLCSREEALSISRTIIENPLKYPPPYGPSFYQIVFDGMARFGLVAEIAGQIQRYWMAMADRGAVTWWEVFDPDSPGWSYPNPFLGNVPTYEMDWIPVSTCHGWSGAPAYALPAYILGLDLTRVHDNQVRISPCYIPGLGNVRYSLCLKGEVLSLLYTDTGSSWEVTVESVPPGLRIEVEPRRET